MRGVDLEQMAATVADGMKVVLMIGDIRLKEEHIGVAGDVYILDASVATPQNFATHFAKFTPSLIKKFLICVQVRSVYDIRPVASVVTKSYFHNHRFSGKCVTLYYREKKTT